MSSEKKVILIVDDAPDNIHLLSGLLNANYKIKAATNGEKAIAIASRTPTPDLILLDVVMPEIDGYAVCETLKNQEVTKNIPVIFVTGNASDAEKQKGFSLGAIGFLRKPVNSAQLFDIVQKTLDS